MAQLGDSAARGATVTLVAQVARFVLQLVSLSVLARLLSPEDFGLVAMVTAVIGVSEILRDFGLSTAAIQAKRLSGGERTNLFWANVALGLGCAILIVAFAPLIVQFYGDDRLHVIILSLCWVFVVSGASTQFKAELTRSLRFKALAVADVGAQACGIVAAITCAMLGGRYWAIVLQQITFIVMTMALSAALCRWRPGLPKRGVSIRRFFRFGAGFLGTQVLAYSTKNADNVAIGAYIGAEPLGLYSRAYQLLMTPLSQINTPMTRVALPILARVQDDDATFQRYLLRAQLVGCYLTATASALVAGLAVPIVAVLFGPGWEGVAPILMILAFGGVFRAVGSIPYWIFLSRGLTSQQFLMYLVVRPVLIAMIVAGVPWGVRGVAAGCSLGYVLDWGVQLWWSGRCARLSVRPIFANALRAIALVSAPIALIAHALSSAISAPWLAIASAALAAVVYLSVLAVLVPPVRQDLRDARDIARRILPRSGRERLVP